MGETPKKSAAQLAREKRLKEALRANLQRRKGQSRGRRSEDAKPEASPETGANEAETS